MKNMLKVLIFALILLGGIGAVNATSILVLPTANQNITGSITANCTGSVTYNNASFQYYSSGWQTIGTNSTSGTQWNLAIDETDAADGQYNMRCLANGTVISSNVSLVGWDDTSPTTSSYSVITDTAVNRVETVTLTCLDADFNNEACSSCSYYQVEGPGKVGDCTTGCSMTASGTTMTYSYTVETYGVRNTYVECTDQRSQSGNTSQVGIDIKSAGSGGPSKYTAPTTQVGVSEAQAAASKRRAEAGGAIVVIIILAGYFYLKSQK